MQARYRRDQLGEQDRQGFTRIARPKMRRLPARVARQSLGNRGMSLGKLRGAPRCAIGRERDERRECSFKVGDERKRSVAFIWLETAAPSRRLDGWCRDRRPRTG